MPESRQVAADLAQVLALLVDQPEQLDVRSVPMRRATVFEVETAAEDVGQVIGRRGRTIRALRTLLDCRGEVDRAQYGLEVLDE
ncbi:MAG TPA: KH domain-containing protein [Thermoanaerobaculia bacterium]|nr:KH domain-containing protein [Thermoanaerobaculia bacterium]